MSLSGRVQVRGDSITFRIRHNYSSEMSIGHLRQCVCLCVCPSPHSYTIERTQLQLWGIVEVPL